MPTALSTILLSVRDQINEPVADFWTDGEIVRYINNGIRDLWRHINQTHQDYHFAIDVAVEQQAGMDTLANVPANCGVVQLLEPLDGESSPLHYWRRSPNHPEFVAARQDQAINPSSGGAIFYAITGAGAPVAAPTIRVAPLLSATIPLRLSYQPVIGPQLTVTDNNPIPGESDQALIEWAAAYAVGRQRHNGTPDAARMANYNVEVQKILIALAPRDESDADVVRGVFDHLW